MKITEARAEAKRRWSWKGFAIQSRTHKATDGTPMKGVGYWLFWGNTKLKEYQGWGKTWEEAFAQADEAKAKQEKDHV